MFITLCDLQYVVVQVFGDYIPGLFAVIGQTANIDLDNEVIKGTLLTQDGQIVHAFAREVFGMEPLEPVAVATDAPDAPENGSEGSDA